MKLDVSTLQLAATPAIVAVPNPARHIHVAIIIGRTPFPRTNSTVLGRPAPASGAVTHLPAISVFGTAVWGARLACAFGEGRAWLHGPNGGLPLVFELGGDESKRVFGAFADFVGACVDACGEDLGQLHDAQDAAFATDCSCECGLCDIDRREDE